MEQVAGNDGVVHVPAADMEAVFAPDGVEPGASPDSKESLEALSAEAEALFEDADIQAAPRRRPILKARGKGGGVDPLDN